MRIRAFRPSPDGTGNTIAFVDIELIPGVTLFGIRVAQMEDKSFRAFGPTTDRNGRSMSFDRSMVEAIGEATLSKMDGHSNNDYRAS